MLELASLYAALANGGELRSTRMLEDKVEPAGSLRLLSREASFLVLDILKDNPVPKSHQRPVPAADGNQVAWKTGTSHGFRDAWAVGVCDGMVIAVWVGNFNGKGNRAFIGRLAAGPLLFDIIAALVPERGWTVARDIDFSRLNLKQIDVCATTGELPGRQCAHTRKSWFIPGVSPIRVCRVHRAVPVDMTTGKRACRDIPGRTRMAVFDFWPSDVLTIFRTAGIALKTPPPYAEDCGLDRCAAAGRAPSITSPQSGLVYVMNRESPKNRQVAFRAVVDGDVHRLYWFVDSRYVGASQPKQPLMWMPPSGIFDVRVVDDHGRAARIDLTVEWVR